MISKALIVGATGKLGGSIARRLLAQGHSVRALVRDPARAEALSVLGAELTQGDLRDKVSLRAACAGVSHVVATANGFLTRYRNSSADVDLNGNMRLIDVCAAAGVGRFVFVSGDIMRADSLTDFFKHKFAAEKHLQKSGLDYVIVRAAAFMDEWAEIVCGNVAEFVARILDDRTVSRESVVFGGPENLRFIDVIEKYERHTGKKARRKHIPVPAMRVLRDVRLQSLDEWLRNNRPEVTLGA